jgi:ABC-type glycerol-3-phosphate transport system substrate-binding protein
MKRTTFVAGAAALTLAACSGAAGTDTTGPDQSPETLAPATTIAPVIPETTSTLADPGTTVTSMAASSDVDELLADLQGRFVEFGEQIEASGVEAELNEAWIDAQAVMLEALTTIQSGEMVDMSTIDSALDDFEQAVPTTETEVLAAWNQLRATLEEAIQTANVG